MGSKKNGSTRQVLIDVELALQESEEKYRSVIEALNSGIIIVNDREEVISANNASAHLIGFEPGQVIGQKIADLADSVVDVSGNKHLFETLPAIRSLREAVSTNDYRLGIKQADNSILWLSVHSSPLIRSGETKPYAAVLSYTNITNKLEAEAALHRSEELYRLLAENSSDIISKHKGDTEFVYVSPACKEILGYENNEIIGRSAFDFVHPDDIKQVRDKLKTLLKAPTTTFTFRCRKKNEEYCCLEICIHPLQSDDNTDTPEFVAVSRDVSERMTIEIALRESESRYKALFENASDAIFIHDLFGRFLELNAVACDSLGYSREKLLQLSPAEIQVDEFASQLPSHIAQLLKDQQLVYETEHIRKNGTTFPVELSNRLINYQGHRAVMSIGRDITERKEFENEREKSLGLLQATIEATADGLLVLSTNGDVILCNRRFKEIWDLPEQWESIGSKDERFSLMASQVSPQDEFMEQIEHFYAYPEDIINDILRLENGRSYERNSFPFKVGSEVAGRSWSFRDVTDRMQAEDKLRKNRAHLKAIFDNAGVAIGLLDANGKFILVNDHWSQLFNVPKKEILKSDPLSFSHPDDYAEGKEQLEAVVNGVSEGYRIEKRYLRPDGSIIWGDLSVTPIYDQNDSLEGILGIITEITQSKYAKEELQAMNAELAERNEELDAFAHTVAHDLKNPLGIILGYGNLLSYHRDELALDEIESIYNGMIVSAEKMKEIIQSLMMLAQIRNQEVSMRKVNMHDVIQESLKHVDRMINERNATISLPETWPVAEGYQPWIEEVWANYLSNAIKYGSTHPKVQLGATEQEDGILRFWIKDDGEGISPENQHKLFNKFSRFDSRHGEGHGLGLSIVKRIVEKMGGNVGLESSSSEGSTFYFTLPRGD